MKLAGKVSLFLFVILATVACRRVPEHTAPAPTHTLAPSPTHVSKAGEDLVAEAGIKPA